jgi:hypothetical protein
MRLAERAERESALDSGCLYTVGDIHSVTTILEVKLKLLYGSALKALRLTEQKAASEA